ncbi:MAG: GTP-binding protein [Clostridia bacterium]|nr:GTP-binding protein [Clostridia bacterium]
MRKTIGILAHVDAGKTTFSEQALYAFSAIRSLGRVDHGNAFLDSHPLEKQRGITIFSDQAYFEKDGDRYFWVDTPGHVDFASEMERAVSILDYAVVIISASDGVQSHTESIWKLLKDYNVPAFLFVNKMDRPGVELRNVMAGLKKELSQDCVYIGTDTLLDEAKEAIAERD